MTSQFGIKEAPQGYGRGVNFFPRKHFRLLSTFFQDPLSKLFRVVAGGWSGPGGGGGGGGASYKQVLPICALPHRLTTVFPLVFASVVALHQFTARVQEK